MKLTYVILLRGINVGGKRKILMKDLIQLLEKGRYQNVQTYIQSGNIVLSSTEKDDSIIEEHIATLIKTEYGFDVPVMALNRKQFDSIYTQNPFLKNDIQSLHVTILNQPQTDIELRADEALRIENQVYLFCPNGYSKTKYTNGFFEKKLNCQATTRNWKTMTKLKVMLGLTD